MASHFFERYHKTWSTVTEAPCAYNFQRRDIESQAQETSCRHLTGVACDAVACEAVDEFFPLRMKGYSNQPIEHYLGRRLQETHESVVREMVDKRARDDKHEKRGERHRNSSQHVNELPFSDSLRLHAFKRSYRPLLQGTRTNIVATSSQPSVLHQRRTGKESPI